MRNCYAYLYELPSVFNHQHCHGYGHMYRFKVIYYFDEQLGFLFVCFPHKGNNILFTGLAVGDLTS